jgi:hypothetical protein
VLDAYIIDEIRQRDEELLRRDERPILQIPIPLVPEDIDEQEEHTEESPRVIIIDI